MNENQRRLLKKLQWFTIPSFLLIVGFSLWPYITSGNKEEAAETSRHFFRLTELLMIIPLIVFAFVVYALMREFFRKRKTIDTKEVLAGALIRIEAPHNKLGMAITLLVVLGFVVLVNLLLFSPETIFEPEQLGEFTIAEKLIFGFFYVICHFLLLAFGRQLFTTNYLFIATTKGFHYTPAGISSGLVLWEDIEEIRESSVLSGNNIGGPTTVPVLGIKLRYPEKYAANYNPALQKLVLLGGQLNNFQTDGVGDILLNPAHFGQRYEEVKALIESKRTHHKPGNNS
ncbi:hypothetical protein [Lacibacter sp.]|uniref:hypothetical protein n=1 Tax=Lacibacter sp. TaxID=1915409 RepID=UPI002B4B7820|nr:hypothetical protein [Lacibacter sp.]HLP36308.1 hypothetical protein [Lacibacter sp.]